MSDSLIFTVCITGSPSSRMLRWWCTITSVSVTYSFITIYQPAGLMLGHFKLMFSICLFIVPVLLWKFYFQERGFGNLVVCIHSWSNYPENNKPVACWSKHCDNYHILHWHWVIKYQLPLRCCNNALAQAPSSSPASLFLPQLMCQSPAATMPERSSDSWFYADMTEHDTAR